MKKLWEIWQESCVVLVQCEWALVAKKEQMPERAAMALTFPRAVMPLGRTWSFLWAWRKKHLNTHEHTNVTFTQPLLVRKMTILVSACWFILFLVVFKLTWIDWATAAW